MNTNASWDGYPEQPAGLDGRQPGWPGGVPARERNWALAAHLSAFLAAFVVLAFVGPLVVLLLGAGGSRFAREHTVEALNFNLSVLLYGFVGGLLVWLLGLGFLILAVVGVLWVVCTIIGAVRASKGEPYRYPLTIRLVH